MKEKNNNVIFLFHFFSRVQYSPIHGCVAQLVEQSAFNRLVRGSSPLTPTIKINKERMCKMASLKDEKPLKMGEIRSIRSNGGTTLNYLELLFSPTTIAKFSVNRETNKIDFMIDHTDLKYQDLTCALTKDVIRDLYINIRDLYNELYDESEENNL